MSNATDAFLHSLDATVRLSGKGRLSAARIRGLGAALGFTEEEIVEHVERLKSENAVELHWGGDISLTPAGRDRAANKSGSSGRGDIYNLAAGAILAQNTTGPVGHGAGATSSTAAVGRAAIGQRSTLATAATGDLAAMLQLLRQQQAGLAEPARAPTQDLLQELEVTIADLQNPNPDKTMIESRLSRVSGLVTQVANIAEASEKLSPILLSLGSTVEKLLHWTGLT